MPDWIYKLEHEVNEILLARRRTKEALTVAKELQKEILIRMKEPKYAALFQWKKSDNTGQKDGNGEATIVSSTTVSESSVTSESKPLSPLLSPRSPETLSPRQSVSGMLTSFSTIFGDTMKTLRENLANKQEAGSHPSSPTGAKPKNRRVQRRKRGSKSSSSSSQENNVGENEAEVDMEEEEEESSSDSEQLLAESEFEENLYIDLTMVEEMWRQFDSFAHCKVCSRFCYLFSLFLSVYVSPCFLIFIFIYLFCVFFG
jgi:hypothetical protein